MMTALRARESSTGARRPLRDLSGSGMLAAKPVAFLRRNGNTEGRKSSIPDSTTPRAAAVSLGLGRCPIPVPSSDVERWLPAARAGSSEALGQMLDAYRAYLLQIAGRELDTQLRAKAGASDLVQETLLEAFRDFAGFHGDTEHRH